MDKNQILDYVMDSPGNTNRAVLSGMLDQMAGGGSSDLSIAKVTIVNNTSDTAEIYGAFIYKGETSGSTLSFIVQSNTTKTAEVILYKGMAAVSPIGNYSITFTGDITESGEVFLVRGDGAFIFGGGGK